MGIPKRSLPRVRSGDEITADAWNRVVEEVERLRVVPGIGINVDPLDAGQVVGLKLALNFRFFYTTSTVTSAAVAGSGVSSATDTLGHGTARPCFMSSANVVGANANGLDTTIYNAVVLTSPIASGKVVLCAWVDARWVVILAAQCS